jgi:hypothetical protein
MANKPLSVVTRYLRDLREIQGLHETPDALLLERFALEHEEAAFAVLGRGFALTIAGLTSLLVVQAAPASLPFVLVKSTSEAAVAFAKGQPAAAVCSAQTARLIQSGLRTLFLTKIKTATALLLAVDLLAGVAVMTHRVLGANGINEPPATAEPGQTGQVLTIPQAERAKDNAHPIVEVAGRVLDPEGRTFAGAKLYLHYRYDRPEQMDYPVRATSDADGRFFFTFDRSLLGSSPHSSWFHVLAMGNRYGPDWVFHKQPEIRAELVLHLVPDIPIQGQILDLDGRPVKDAKLRIESTAAYSNTEDFLQSVRDREWPKVGAKGWSGPFPGQPPTLTTDADRRFRLPGVGKDRLVQFQVQGPNIQWRPVRVLARDMKAPVEPRKQQYGALYQTVYPATFHYISQPSRLIRGVVRDKNTGRRVEGVRVNGDYTTDHATTDAGGRFELRGIPKSEGGYR